MRRTLLIAVWLVALLTCVHSSLAQGRLDEVRRDVREPTPEYAGPAPPNAPAPPAEVGGNPPQNDVDGDDDDDDLDLEDYTVLSTLAALGITSPVWLPHWVLHDDFANTSYFPSYPYRYGEGYISDQSVKQREWAARAWLDYGDDFQGVDRAGGGFLLATSFRIGLDGAWNYYQEEIAADAIDSLSVGDFNLNWRFAQHPWAEFRLGAGVNWLHDRADTDPGLNLTYAFDVYPLQPLVLSAEMDFGFLWEHSMFHARLTAGVIVNRFEFFAGYDYLDIGRAALGQPLVGLRIWL